MDTDQDIKHLAHKEMKIGTKDTTLKKIFSGEVPRKEENRTQGFKPIIKSTL